MDYKEQPMWKGSTMPSTFPHVCPFRLEGADKKSCLELSGTNYHQNRNGCCGTSRGSAYFEPCNSEVRRCIVCIQMGRRGLKANPVTNVTAGTCDEHAAGVATQKQSTYVPTVATRLAINRPRQAVQQDIVPLRVTQIVPLKEQKPSKIKQKTSPKKGSTKSKGTRYAPETRAAALSVLMQIREEMRQNKEPAPYKRQLAKLAAEKIGWQMRTVENFIYTDLTKEEMKKLEFGLPPNPPTYTEKEQIEILKRVRKEMADRNVPFVRVVDLAKAVAPIVRRKVSGVEALITDLPESIREELDLGGSNSRLLAGHDADTIRSGFVGAIAVLKLQRTPLTIPNLQKVLRIKLRLVEEYLKEHPDVGKLFDDTT